MSYDIMFQQALAFHRQGNLDAAENLYRQILETAPDHPDVLNLLGLIAQARGVHNEAVALFYKAVKHAPQHAPFYFNLGISLFAQNKLPEASDILNHAISLQPDFKEAYNQLGLVLKEQNRIDEAKQAFAKAAELDADYVDALANLAMLEENAEATVRLSDLARRFPENPLIRFYLARLYLQNNNLKNAEKYALQADEFAPEQEDVTRLLAEIMLQKQDEKQAENYLRQTLKQNPVNIFALINLADILTRRQNFDEAERLYRQAIETAPQNLDAHANYAALLYEQKRTAEALEEYRKAVIINPKVAEVSNNLGLILKDMEEYEEALGLFFNAFALKPQLEEISLNIAETLTLFSRQDKETAAKIAQNWLKLAPENVFACRLSAAFNGEIPEKSESYSQKLFDNFAENYEQVLQKIDYTLPQQIKMLADNPSGTIVDLGCGTGLIGQMIKSEQNQLIGVDISKKMLAQAKRKNIYKQLHHSDILSYLKDVITQDAPSLVIAADVFCYLGNLEEIICRLAPYKAVFSIETLENTKQDFILTETGRFRHAPHYIEKLLKKHHCSFKTQSVELRRENNIPVEGTIFVTTPENA